MVQLIVFQSAIHTILAGPQTLNENSSTGVLVTGESMLPAKQLQKHSRLYSVFLDHLRFMVRECMAITMEDTGTPKQTAMSTFFTYGTVE